MSLESFNFIDSLNASNPTTTDNVSEGDDHIRGIKSTLKTTFPNINGAVNATDEEINLLDGVTATTAELNTLDGITATVAELNYTDGVTSNIQTQLGTKLPLAGGTMTGTIAGFTSTGIDDNATSTAITIDASENVTLAGTISDINGNVRSGRKNFIINGGFDVWQRGTSFTASGGYSADRWKAQFGGNQGTVAQETTSLPAGSRYGLKMTATATDAVGWSQMGQQIEYKNLYHAVGQTVTVSFYAKAHNSNSGSTSLILRTRTHTTEDGAAIFAGTGVTNSFTLTTNWVKYTTTRTIPSDSKAWSVEFVMGGFVSGDGYTIADVQLELGSVATDFEHRSYGEELALCQRYYEVIKNVRFRGFHPTDTGSNYHYISTPVTFYPKRVSPTVTRDGTGFTSMQMSIASEQSGSYGYIYYGSSGGDDTNSFYLDAEL